MSQHTAGVAKDKNTHKRVWLRCVFGGRRFVSQVFVVDNAMASHVGVVQREAGVGAR